MRERDVCANAIVAAATEVTLHTEGMRDDERATSVNDVMLL